MAERGRKIDKEKHCIQNWKKVNHFKWKQVEGIMASSDNTKEGSSSLSDKPQQDELTVLL